MTMLFQYTYKLDILKEFYGIFPFKVKDQNPKNDCKGIIFTRKRTYVLFAPKIIYVYISYLPVTCSMNAYWTPAIGQPLF